MGNQLGFEYNQLPKDIRRHIPARSIYEKAQRFPELMDLLQTWWPGARIVEEIKSRTGWLLPAGKIVFSLRRNSENRASIKTKSLQDFGFRKLVLFDPDDARRFMNRQIDEIQRFKVFCQQHLSVQPPQPCTLKEAQALSRRYGLMAVSRRFGIKARCLNALIRANKEIIAAENFAIVGLRSTIHARLVAAGEIEEFFCKFLTGQIGGQDLDRLEQIRQGKKFLVEILRGTWNNWWTGQKISQIIQKRCQGWFLKPSAVVAYLKQEHRRRNVPLWSLKGLTGRKLNVVPKDVARRVVNEQVREIRRLCRFCRRHLPSVGAVTTIDQAGQIWARWNLRAASQRFRIGLATLGALIKKGKIRCEPFRIIGLHRNFQLVSGRDVRAFLEGIQKRLQRFSPDPNNPLTLEDVFTKWWAVNRIQEEIANRTKQAGKEWHIRGQILRVYLKKKAMPVFKLKGFARTSQLFICPDEAEKLIASQSAEIKKLQRFVQEHLGNTNVPHDSQTALTLIKSYGVKATQRALKVSGRQFQRMLKEGLLKSEQFSIIGLGSRYRYRLFFPEKTLEIQLLIQAYQNPSGRSTREVWSELVQTGLRCFEEFRWVIDNSEEEAVRAFCNSEPGKMLIDYLGRTQNAKK